MFSHWNERHFSEVKLGSDIAKARRLKSSRAIMFNRQALVDVYKVVK